MVYLKTDKQQQDRLRTWCLRRSTFRFPFWILGGSGCNGRLNISSTEHKLSKRVCRRLSSSTFSRLAIICLSSAAFSRDACCFTKVSCCLFIASRCAAEMLGVCCIAEYSSRSVLYPGLAVLVNKLVLEFEPAALLFREKPRCPGVAQISWGSRTSRLSAAPYIFKILGLVSN